MFDSAVRKRDLSCDLRVRYDRFGLKKCGLRNQWEKQMGGEKKKGMGLPGRHRHYQGVPFRHGLSSAAVSTRVWKSSANQGRM